MEETDERGRKRRTTQAKDTRRGIPQGSPISPLLANLYMRRFVLGWKQRRLEHRLGSRIVTYADDLVICCRRGSADEALSQMRELMGKLKLEVNEEKTRVCRMPEETLPSTFRNCRKSAGSKMLYQHRFPVIQGSRTSSWKTSSDPLC